MSESEVNAQETVQEVATEQAPEAISEPAAEAEAVVEPEQDAAEEAEDEKKHDEKEEDDEKDDNEKGAEEKGAEEEVQDTRDHLNIVFIGHVDAGKSTISGNLLYLNGMVDDRTIAKYEKEAKDKKHASWFLAFIMDTNEEERAKGKTVEVGRAYFATEKRRYTILDAPGHKNYVPNMIGGAAQADVGILVISARKGEFESGFDKGGQTREHATLAMTLGVRQLVVVVNKMDDETVEWAEDRYKDIVKKLTPFLKGLSYKPEDLFWIPIAGRAGQNLKDRLDPSICSWYEGPSFMELIDSLPPPSRELDGCIRVPVLDTYRDKGSTVVMGKIEAGTLSQGLKVLLMPNNQLTEVTFLEIEEKTVSKANAGENVNVGLKDVNKGDVRSGFMLCDIEKPIPCVSDFEAQLIIIDTLPTKPVISAGYKAIIHIHTCSEEIEVERLISQMNKKTKKQSTRPPTFVKKGDVVVAHIRAANRICMELYDTVRQLGRFTLRDQKQTIAVGKVLRLIEN